jgi:beta-galactosidase
VSDANLTLFLRVGPWAHGESRHGGFPDWLVSTPGIRLRSLQPLFMGFVKILYQQIANQLQGLYWSDGGPVVGVQVLLLCSKNK